MRLLSVYARVYSGPFADEDLCTGSPSGRPLVHLSYSTLPSSYLCSLYLHHLHLTAHHQHAQLLHLLLAPLLLPGHQGFVHLHHSATTAKIFRGVNLSSFFIFYLPAAVNSISKPTFQTTFPQDGSEQVFRPSNVQSKRMDDVGTRSIFTPEQVKRNVSRTERNAPPPLCRICSGSLSGSSCRIPLHLNRSNTASQHSKKHAHLPPSRDLQKNHCSKRWIQTK